MTDRITAGKEQYTLCNTCGKTFTGTSAFDSHRLHAEQARRLVEQDADACRRRAPVAELHRRHF